MQQPSTLRRVPIRHDVSRTTIDVTTVATPLSVPSVATPLGAPAIASAASHPRTSSKTFDIMAPTAKTRRAAKPAAKTRRSAQHTPKAHRATQPNPVPVMPAVSVPKTAPKTRTTPKSASVPAAQPAKPTRRKSKITPRHLVMFFAGIIFVACLTLLGIWLLDGFRSQQEYQQLADTATTSTGDGDAATDQTINFAELTSTNPDTVAWVRIPNTTVNYPVVQTNNNVTYLSRTFTGGTSLSGTIFLDAGNAADFSSTNSILYGHNRVDGTMFADLDRIYDGNLGNDIKIYLYLPDGTVRTYRVFSAYITANDPISINPSVTDFAGFAADMLARSERDFNLDPLAVTVRDNTAGNSATSNVAADTAGNATTLNAPTPQILTLSTCVANDDRRYLFHAVLTQIDSV